MNETETKRFRRRSIFELAFGIAPGNGSLPAHASTAALAKSQSAF